VTGSRVVTAFSWALSPGFDSMNWSVIADRMGALSTRSAGETRRGPAQSAVTTGRDDETSEPPTRSDCRVLNIAVATPEERPGGAVRAGLRFGDHLAAHAAVDNVKMRGRHDDALLSELALDNAVGTVPTRDGLCRLVGRLWPSAARYANTLVWTDLGDVAVGDYDVVHIHNPVPLGGMVAVALACRVAGVPYCVTTHGLSKVPDIPDAMDMSAPAAAAYSLGFVRPYFWVLGNAACLFALSEADRRTLRARFPDQRLRVVPNGVEPNPPADDVAATVASAADIPRDRPLVLFVGRLAHDKGVGDLLDAAERLTAPCTVALVGPAESSALEARALAADGVRYLGYTEQSLLGRLYQRADLFCLPTRTDVFPLVVLEAMAAKTPVVSTTVGGIPEQVTEATGRLHDPDDVDALATSLDALLRDERTRETMAEAAFERAMREFSWDAVCRAAVEEYEQLCSSC